MVKEKEDNKKLSPKELLLKNFEEKFGVGIIKTAHEILDKPQQIIPVSPKLDMIFGGGIPEGSWLTLTGKRKCGKTTTALHFAAKCQLPEHGFREVYYIDIEGRLKKMNLQGIANLNMEKFHAVQSTKDKIMSGQEFLTAAEHILKTQEKAVVIIDSYSQICHEKELVEGVGVSTRGAGGYTLLAQFCRQMSNVVPVMNSIVIGITHLMANVSGYGAPLVEKGGNAIEYQGDVKARAKSVTAWKVGGDGGKQIGQIVTWVCEWSALCGPGNEVESYIRYGKGIDELYEVIACAMEIGLITGGGAKSSWYTLNFIEEAPKLQGGENVYKYISSNPEVQKKLLTQVSQMMQP